MDLSKAPEVPKDLDGDVFDRLTVEIVRETTKLDFEMEVWLAEAGEAGPSRPCGQRAKALCQAKDRLTATSKQKAFIGNLSAKLEPTLTIRNALVHGLVGYGSVDGEPCIFMQTLEQFRSQTHARHCLTIANIENAIEFIKRVNGQLSTFRAQRTDTKFPTPPA